MLHPSNLLPAQYMYIDSLSMSLGAETPFVILLFSAIVVVDIFPLEALTLFIKHCQCITVVRVGYKSCLTIQPRPRVTLTIL